MSVNKHRPHLYIVPEDDADRGLAVGFVQHDQVDLRAVQIVALAGGWLKARDVLVEEYLPLLARNVNCHVLLIIDLDEQGERHREEVQSVVPPDTADRVFVLCCADDPEALHRSPGQSVETIGRALAEECFEGRHDLWHHAELVHNSAELERLTAKVRPFLFRTV